MPWAHDVRRLKQLCCKMQQICHCPFETNGGLGAFLVKSSITAVRLSAGLVASAKAEAALQSRSIAGQVEHWARLGMALESLPSARLSEVRNLLMHDNEGPLPSAVESPASAGPGVRGPRRR